MCIFIPGPYDILSYVCLLDSVIMWLYDDVNHSWKKRVMKLEHLGAAISFETSKGLGGHDRTRKHVSFVKWKLFNKISVVKQFLIFIFSC